jgi:hypothetical protein
MTPQETQRLTVQLPVIGRAVEMARQRVRP